ncbi:MAG TPA: hypothetical protein VN541_13005, partial [Tepidisphaeraceae bacterium]|nr:hypothetical protein [Tepidisphaeraceae bacterium]
MNRREFLQRAGLAVGSVLVWWDTSEGEDTPRMTDLWVVRDPADAIASAAPVEWAVKQVGAVLGGIGVSLRNCRSISDVPAGAPCLIAAGPKAEPARDVLSTQHVSFPDRPESLALFNTSVAGHKTLVACGRDVRGLVYALTEIADMASHPMEAGSLLDQEKSVVEQPANSV